jgi:hypothetical protein
MLFELPSANSNFSICFSSFFFSSFYGQNPTFTFLLFTLQLAKSNCHASAFHVSTNKIQFSRLCFSRFYWQITIVTFLLFTFLQTKPNFQVSVFHVPIFTLTFSNFLRNKKQFFQSIFLRKFGFNLPLTFSRYSGFGTKLSPIFGFAKLSQIQNQLSIKPIAQIRCSVCWQ